MKDWSAIHERYMRDPLPIRLGGLVANLSRIKSFSAHDESRDTVASFIEESKMFIEWTASQAEVNTAAFMEDVQIQLALWQLSWDKIWMDADTRKQLAEKSDAWSNQILEFSGLLR